MSVATITVVGIVIAIVAWSLSIAGRDRASADRLSIGVTLGVLAAACNLIVPVPSVELTTLLIVCTAVALGFRAGVVVATVAVLGSALSGGVGPWTAWQIVAFCVVAALASSVPVTRWSPATTKVWLAGVIVAGTLAYDVIVTTTGIQFIGLARVDNSIPAALLIGLPYTVIHVASNGLLAVSIGPVVLRALLRARERTSAPSAVELSAR